MKYLLDANIFLEVILERQNHQQVRQFLGSVPGRLLATTDFALHAIGIYMCKQHPELLLEFLDELIRNEVGVLHLPPTSLRQALEVMKAHQLDFDDAFQYVAAERFDLKIVSFDADFDRTPRGRITPAQAIDELSKSSR